MSSKTISIARAAYEAGFNDGAAEALDSFCATLVFLADQPAICAMVARKALLTTANSMKAAGNVPFELASKDKPESLADVIEQLQAERSE